MLGVTHLFLMMAVVTQPDAAKPAKTEPIGNLEVVAKFNGPMPTGVTVSESGRIFVCYPRWGDVVEFTVGELESGKAVPFPSAEFNRFDKTNVAGSLVSVQSVVVDPKDRLWMLDTGSVEFGPTMPNGPKLVGVDLRMNKVVQTITFPADVALKTTYLNDVRFDLRRGKAGVAYITDSSTDGPNGLIVVDLSSGSSRRRLNDDPSTKADDKFVPIVEGKPLLKRPSPGKSSHMTFGTDGIAISADGKHLIYCPLSSRRIYRVSTDALLSDQSDTEVAKTIESLGVRDFASDGLESDDKGRLYLTDYEHNAIMRRGKDGKYETLVRDSRMLWTDTMSVAKDGFLYFIANQLHRQKDFHEGKDLRQTPYLLLRTRIDAGPVSLRSGNP
jgi:sugar lactone lactonase YvrE